MITRIRSWWDRRSPWARAARAQDRAAGVLVNLIESEREFAAYIAWASAEIDARDADLRELRSRLRDAQALHARDMAETTQALLERNRARAVAVALEQQLAATDRGGR